MEQGIVDLAGGLARFAGLLGAEGVPWLLLLVVLLVRPPAVREIGAARRAMDARDFGHRMNLTRFRRALAQRRHHDRAARNGGRS